MNSIRSSNANTMDDIATAEHLALLDGD